jgi:hypothetical protein
MIGDVIDILGSAGQGAYLLVQSLRAGAANLRFRQWAFR